MRVHDAQVLATGGAVAGTPPVVDYEGATLLLAIGQDGAAAELRLQGIDARDAISVLFMAARDIANMVDLEPRSLMRALGHALGVDDAPQQGGPYL